jgi:hypothetical protein
MTTINQTSHVNVEYTLNNWLAADLAAISRPSWLPSNPPLVFDAPDIESSLPCFSVAHLPLASQDEFLGRQAGNGQGLVRSALLEVSAWVSRANPNWIAQLRTMEDMLATVVAATSSKLIKDFAANPSSPATTAYKVNIQGLERVRSTLGQSAAEAAAVEVGANPDLRGRRMFIGYWWVYRI